MATNSVYVKISRRGDSPRPKYNPFFSVSLVCHLQKNMPKLCFYSGCSTRANYGYEGGKAVSCKLHSTGGMVNVTSKRCGKKNCSKQPTVGKAGTKTPIFCGKHGERDMVNVVTKRCANSDCSTMPIFGEKGTKKPTVCKDHKEEGMVDVVNPRCGVSGCSTRGSPKFCSKHSKHRKNGTVGVRRRSKQPSTSGKRKRVARPPPSPAATQHTQSPVSAGLSEEEEDGDTRDTEPGASSVSADGADGRYKTPFYTTRRQSKTSNLTPSLVFFVPVPTQQHIGPAEHPPAPQETVAAPANPVAAASAPTPSSPPRGAQVPASAGSSDEEDGVGTETDEPWVSADGARRLT